MNELFESFPIQNSAVSHLHFYTPSDGLSTNLISVNFNGSHSIFDAKDPTKTISIIEESKKISFSILANKFLLKFFQTGEVLFHNLENEECNKIVHEENEIIVAAKLLSKDELILGTQNGKLIKLNLENFREEVLVDFECQITVIENLSDGKILILFEQKSLAIFDLKLQKVEFAVRLKTFEISSHFLFKNTLFLGDVKGYINKIDINQFLTKKDQIIKSKKMHESFLLKIEIIENILITSSDDGVLKLWKVDKFELIKEIKVFVDTVSTFLKSEDAFYFGGFDGKILKINNENLMGILRVFENEKAEILGLKIQEDELLKAKSKQNKKKVPKKDK